MAQRQPSSSGQTQPGALTPSALSLDTFAVLCWAVWGAEHAVTPWSPSQGRKLSAAAGALRCHSYEAQSNLSSSAPQPWSQAKHQRAHLDGPHSHFSASHTPKETPAFLPVQNAPTMICVFHHTSLSWGRIEAAVFRNHRHSTLAWWCIYMASSFLCQALVKGEGHELH